MNRRVASFQEKSMYYSNSFLALKMAAAVHTGPELKTQTNCQKRAEKGRTVKIGQKFLLTVGGGKRLVGCGQISF